MPEDGPWETVGGLLMARLGRIPVEGDEVLEGRVRLRVDRMAGRRVERVLVTEVPDDEAGEG